MKKKKAQIIFFGTEDFSLPSLKGLVEHGFDIEAVVTKPDTQRGRGKKQVPPAVKSFAKKHGLNVLQPISSKELIAVVRQHEANIGILVAYGKILPAEVIDFFQNSIVNAHPSLLPKHRGPSPIEAAILNGDKKTGTTLMQITEAMDAGPIYIQEEVSLKGDETKPLLSEHLANKSARLLIDNLDAIIQGDIKPTPQKDSQATYTKLIKKGDGDLDWSESATVNERRIRAYLGWPGSQAQIKDTSIIVLKASVINQSAKPGSVTIKNGFPVIGCRKNSLKLERVKPLSKGAMDGDDFVRGYLNN